MIWGTFWSMLAKSSSVPGIMIWRKYLRINLYQQSPPGCNEAMVY
jgi:hypothetical protein